MARKVVAVAVAVTTATVVGLVVLALPVITAAAGAIGAAAHGAGEEPAAAPVLQTSSPAPSSAADMDLPPGYVEIGHGLSIPAGGAGDCTATAWFWTGMDDGDTHMRAELLGSLVDMGPMTSAEGTVGRDADGTIVSYTVAAGDAVFAIGDRLCAEGLTIAGYNNVLPSEIQPGQTLDLDPDPDAVWTSR